MLEKTLLQSNVFMGPLRGQSTLRPKGNSFKRSLLFTLTLTSLIDAFVIIVIYLLVNFGNPNQNLKVNGDIQLPQAVQNDQMGEGTMISLNNGHYFIEDKEVAFGDITKKFVEIAQGANFNQNLVIQADKKTDYEILSPIILAGSQAGFHQFKFAVIQGEEK
jgi:biopolymer transport protein ExbD